MADSSMTSFGKDIPNEIKEGDEELLWQGVPQKASFVLSKSVQLLPIALIWLCFDGFAISMIFQSDIPKGMIVFLIIFFAFHLLPVWLWIYQILSARRKHKLIEYAFTNQRVIIRDAGILRSYYYKDLRHVSVKVGFIDKLFKVGDITLYGSRNVVLLDIDNPYAVGNKLQQFVDMFAQERENQKKSRKNDVEYEDYYEHGDAPIYEHEDFDYQDDDEFYDDSQYESQIESQRSALNDFEDDTPNYSSSISSKGRYTSKKKPSSPDKTEEDEYLDNIMNSIDKKDEF